MLICLIILCFTTLTFNKSPIELAKSYDSITGIQIYLYEDTRKFIYLSINNSSKVELTASLNIYLDVIESDISIGLWFAIGFGTINMPDSEIILCSLSYDKKASCRDYIAKGWDIVEKEIQSTLLISYELASLDASYSPYKTSIIFEFNNKLFTRMQRIYNGEESIVSAFGNLDLNNKPLAHLNNDISIISSTTDGAYYNQMKIQESTTKEISNTQTKFLISVPFKRDTTISSSTISLYLIFHIALVLILIN